jgi:hypothetical protein
MQVLAGVKDKLKPDLYEFVAEKLGKKDKKVLMVIKCFNRNKDESDMINSM